jgi:hypothetical protein
MYTVLEGLRMWALSGSKGGFIIMPSDPFPVQPLSSPGLAGLSAKGAIAMLFSILPMPNIFPSIRPEKGAKTLLLIFKVFSIVAATVRPSEVSPAVHLIILPCPRVLSPVPPAVPALTLYVIL